MKNYKFLIPLFLVLIFVMSFYMLYDTKATVVNQYQEYLSAARSCREQGVLVDAEAYYQNALEVTPSLELSLEIGQFYIENASSKTVFEWAESVVDQYPKEVKAYEFLMNLHMESKDYAACFSLANQFYKRELVSDRIAQQLSTIEYEFYFSGEYDDVGVFGGGYCPVLLGNKWGYVNAKGSKTVANQFVKVGAFSGGLAPVVNTKGEAYFIDVVGNKKFVVMNVENITELGLIENGVYSLYNGTEWGFYDSEYHLLFGGYQAVSVMGNGIAAVKANDAGWTLVNRTGADLTGKCYSAVVMDEKSVVYRNGRLFVSDGVGYRMIDSTGTVYGTETYEDAHLFNDSTYAAVKLNGKWGYVDAEGKIVIEPQYSDARSFSNGYAAVEKDGKWGFIDLQGNIVIEPQFENTKDFNNYGCVFVVRDEAWELLKLYKNNF